MRDSITEVFCEWDFDDELAAHTRRDERLAELSVAGFDCVARDLYAIHNGRRVFVVCAEPTIEFEPEMRRTFRRAGSAIDVNNIDVNDSAIAKRPLRGIGTSKPSLKPTDRYARRRTLIAS